ncbi:MAG TPA: hypothetical protein VFI24_20590 [Pyrinomonadaceae bacterium]|nr:hypothetical protein [Pyrinomonadaceae bacterium]
MARNEREQGTVRRYLLNQLNDAEQKAVEHELLADETFSEELDIVEDELIDAYLNGELSRQERKRFERFFLAHETRKDKLRGGQTLKRHFGKVSPTPSPRGFVAFIKPLFNPFPSQIGAVVAILAVAVVGVVVWRVLFYQSDLQKGLIALNESYRQERLVEARISNFNYAPYRPTRGGEPGKVNTLEQTRAERLLSEAYSKKPDAATNHALGQMYFLRRDFDKAIEHLEQAKRADANNAGIYVDLAAAYLEKGRLDNKPEQDQTLLLSIENLNRALELKPNLREALFNRALVHQYQGLNDQAVSDWRAYLEQDANSPWATEARDNLRAVEQRGSER